MSWVGGKSYREEQAATLVLGTRSREERKTFTGGGECSVAPNGCVWENRGPIMDNSCFFDMRAGAPGR